MKIQFIAPSRFGRDEKRTKPRKPATGPFFRRPDGARDPKAEERINLLAGWLASQC